ncbi:hypothetical protein BDN71DRAFT_1436918 [Pleurotus eryngii]|uniref:Uncharacterized protein n=1 Tax=Pleurotus eryngii TaxID=5323 RepID=A0A9P6D1E2_PLEER|nr:hypothetical protein BDN71DRAFT_1436918 [Pleurotus eryngii]
MRPHSNIQIFTLHIRIQSAFGRVRNVTSLHPRTGVSPSRRLEIARYYALSVLMDEGSLPHASVSWPSVSRYCCTGDEVTSVPPLEGSEAYKGADWDTTLVRNSGTHPRIAVSAAPFGVSARGGAMNRRSIASPPYCTSSVLRQDGWRPASRKARLADETLLLNRWISGIGARIEYSREVKDGGRWGREASSAGGDGSRVVGATGSSSVQAYSYGFVGGERGSQASLPLYGTHIDIRGGVSLAERMSNVEEEGYSLPRMHDLVRSN